MSESREELLAQAEAAERTVEVLKRKVIELYNGGGSSLQKQLESARRREEENRRKREIVELRAKELKRYSETLEVEVARRTEAIKTILDNVTFGFLVVNRDLVVQPSFTRSCHRFFGTETVSGEPLCDLLGLTGRARQEVRPVVASACLQSNPRSIRRLASSTSNRSRAAGRRSVSPSRRAPGSCRLAEMGATRRSAE